MARMEVKYLIHEENKVGVENVKEGSLFMWFKLGGDPDVLADDIGKTFDRIVKLNKNEVLQITFAAFFDGIEILTGSLYREGEGRWITPISETIH
jgi:hypothetical protein